MNRMLEVSFLLNKCGMKTATVGLEITDDFTPYLFLHRHPSLSIKLSLYEHLLLRHNLNTISSFFTESRDAKTSVLLGDTIRVRCETLIPYGKVVIVESIGTDKNTCIYYVKSTWDNYVKLSGVIHHHLNRLTDIMVPEVKKMIHSIAKKIMSSECTLSKIVRLNIESNDVARKINEQLVEKTLDELKSSEHTNKSAPIDMDWYELYQSIKCFCHQAVYVACLKCENEKNGEKKNEVVEEVEEIEEVEEVEDEVGEDLNTPPRKIAKK